MIENIAEQMNLLIKENEELHERILALESEMQTINSRFFSDPIELDAQQLRIILVSLVAKFGESRSGNRSPRSYTVQLPYILLNDDLFLAIQRDSNSNNFHLIAFEK